MFPAVCREAKQKKKQNPNSLQQLPQNFSFLARPLRHPVFYDQRFSSAGPASPFCPPPALRAPAGPGEGGGAGRPWKGPCWPRLPTEHRKSLGQAQTSQPWEDGSRQDRGGGRPSSRVGQPPASGKGRAPTNTTRWLPEKLRPPPTELLMGSGGDTSSPSCPGRALRRGEVPRIAHPRPQPFPAAPSLLTNTTPPNGQMDAPAHRACVQRGVYHYVTAGGTREDSSIASRRGASNLPSPHGGMGAGGKGGERICRVKFKGDREKRKEKEKGA